MSDGKCDFALQQIPTEKKRLASRTVYMHKLPSFVDISRPGRAGCVRFVVFVLMVSALVSFAGVSHAASQQAEFRDALSYFKKVSSSSRLSSRRDMWMDVHSRFKRTLNMNTSSSYGPKSLYYMARCYEELALKSWLKADARKAVDAFQRAANHFPQGHSWVDDCLYRKASLSHSRLKDARGAASDLNLILQQFSGGDQAAKARKLLAELHGEGVVVKEQPRKAETAKRSGTAALRTEYTRAVDRFTALKQKTSPGRDEFLRLAREFRNISLVHGAGVYAGRAAYFEGQTYYELARISGRRDDYEAATERYQRAFDMFEPSDSWRDDALYRKGYIEYTYLHDEDQAYADLLRAVRDYPRGDRNADAKKLLREMDVKRAGKKPVKAAVVEKSASPVSTDGVARLLKIRHRSGDDFTRVVLDMDKGVRFEDHSLPSDPNNNKPHRMFIDLKGTRLAPDLAARVSVKDGLLSGVRAGQNDTRTARVVLDFQRLSKYHLFTLENPFRIVIDVFAKEGAPAVTASARKALPAVKHKPTAKDKQVAKDVLAQLGMTIQTIMIDAGHGGKDPGALDYQRYKDKHGRSKRRIRTKEKDITLRLAKILGDKFRSKGYRVLYTRTNDTKVPLEERALAANIKKADLFVSLHCNANRKSSVRGFETYYLGKARNDIVLRLAAKENDVDPVRISDTQKIVMDLVHSFKIKESQVLAKHVQSNCVRTLRKSYKGVRDHGSRSAPFFVLIGARMPAILVETGYITNPVEAEWLRSNTYLNKVADGIVQGVDAYRRELAQVGS